MAHRTALLFLALLMLLSAMSAGAQISVTTAQYDNARTNGNLGETTLNTSNVNVNHFGKLFTRTLDGYSYTLPLYVPNLKFHGKLHNVVFVATMHDSVYAFDADTASSSQPLWKTSLGTPLATHFPVSPYIQPEIGILSTPVIDPSTNTLYAVAVTSTDQITPSLSLHALDLLTGAEKFNGPVQIQAQVIGATGPVVYDPHTIVQRTALLLVGGAVYLGFADATPSVAWHGWVMGYSASDLRKQTAVFNTTPNGASGGIWQSGRGLAADANGYIYLMDSDGDYDGSSNFSDAFLKLATPGLTVADWFTPSDFSELNTDDLDLGSSGPILIPGTNHIVGGGKNGMVYLLNSAAMGHLQSSSSGPLQSFLATAGCSSGVTCAEIHSTALWNCAGSPVLYVWGWNDTLRGYRMANGLFNTQEFAESAVTSAYPGGGITLSASGCTSGTGIVWSTTSPDNTYTYIGSDVVRAFDAETLQELWNSNQNAARDGAGNIAKFMEPMVANGKVYVPTFSKELVVYGLLPKSRK